MVDEPASFMSATPFCFRCEHRSGGPVVMVSTATGIMVSSVLLGLGWAGLDEASDRTESSEEGTRRSGGE